MICPNCENEMYHTPYKETMKWKEISAIYGFIMHSHYICNSCKIERLNGKWILPSNIEKPTEKQINTIGFINSVLKTNIEPITKYQCWKFINANFEKAKENAEVVKGKEKLRPRYSYNQTYHFNKQRNSTIYDGCVNDIDGIPDECNLF